MSRLTKSWTLKNLHLFICWYKSCPSVWDYVFQFHLLNDCNEMQMDSSLNQPICCMPDKQIFLSVAACCYVSTDVLHQPPSACWVLLWALSHWGISLSVSGCTDAVLPLLKARHRLRVTSLLLPAPISQAYDFLCRAQSPIVKPQVTPDPSALPPLDRG